MRIKCPVCKRPVQLVDTGKSGKFMRSHRRDARSRQICSGSRGKVELDPGQTMALVSWPDADILADLVPPPRRSVASHELKTNATCPKCHKKMDGATNVTGQTAPNKGDHSVCFYCGAILVYVEEQGQLGLREQSAGEFASIPPDVRDLLRRIQRRIRQAQSSSNN